ncbi:MAG: choline dehydrogenase [Hyphomicrobiales bacterium]
MTQNFDYIVIGAGSAGSVLASRLSEDGKNTVLVLEYGGTDVGPLIQMPSALSYPMNMSTYDWGYWSEPEPHLGGRKLACPRGKVVGGSSSINGMVYVRGNARDFDNWEESGAAGWGYRHVLPYYNRMETSHGGEGNGVRGHNGPMHITRGKLSNPLYKAFIDAGAEAGYETTEDYNGTKQEGFGLMEMTVWKGRRWSTANAYLHPASKKKNLTLVTRALARRILVEGKRATGVEYTQRGKVQTVLANKEVIIAASSINSPKLLMLSGIGNQEHLASVGVTLVHHLPGVGENLQDHLELLVQQECVQPVTLHPRMNLFSKALIGMEWLLKKSGLGATNHFEAAGFIRSMAGVDYPDIQYHFLPIAIRYDGKVTNGKHGFQAHVGPQRSASRGTIRLRSAAPEDNPEIKFNYMSQEKDWEDFRTCIRLTREIFSQEKMAPFAGEELTPGAQRQSDEELDDYVREHVESAYHPCGTCKMGAVDDALAVVDPECRVIGMDGLRVVDSSIMPRIPNGNLNGPSIMIGEKASDMILGRDRLPPSNVEPWIHPNWRSQQR